MEVHYSEQVGGPRRAPTLLSVLSALADEGAIEASVETIRSLSEIAMAELGEVEGMAGPGDRTPGPPIYRQMGRLEPRDHP